MVYLPTCYMYKKNQPIQCRYICHTWICVGLKTKDGIISSDFPSSPCLRVKPLGRENGGSNGCWLQPLSIFFQCLITINWYRILSSKFQDKYRMYRRYFHSKDSKVWIEPVEVLYEITQPERSWLKLSLPACVVLVGETSTFVHSSKQFLSISMSGIFPLHHDEKSWMSKGCFWKSSWDWLAVILKFSSFVLVTCVINMVAPFPKMTRSTPLVIKHRTFSCDAIWW